MEGDGMSATDKVKEADWRLFRSRLPIWQEAYMERLNREISLCSQGPAPHPRNSGSWKDACARTKGGAAW